MPLRSMTGCGVGEALIAGSATDKISIEVRAVNHRFLDVRVRVPSSLPDLTPLVEGLARERLTRGRFDILVRLDGAGLGRAQLDRERARSAFAALKDLRDELAPGTEIPLSLIGTVPDLFVISLARDPDDLARAVAAAFDASLASLDSMRLREGLALEADFVRRLATVRRLGGAIGGRAPLVIDAYAKKLAKRAERLRVAAGDIELDRMRLEQEVALFADRIDIAEELTRLESHCAHLESMFGNAEPVGRRLDFLLQEMAREANTIGSKSQDSDIAHAVVELKAEIECMREQSQNVQ